MTKKVLKVLGLGFLGTLIVSCFGLSAVIYQDTLIQWWQPVVFSLIVALGSGKFLWKKWAALTDTDNVWCNFGLHTVTVTAVMLGGLFIGNYFLGDRNDVKYHDVTITRIYREKHHKTRRISRRVYGQGAPYWVYKADFEMPNGENKSLRLTKKHYDQLSKGDTLGLAIREGFFGATVIDTGKIKYPKKYNKSRKKRQFGYRSRKNQPDD